LAFWVASAAVGGGQVHAAAQRAALAAERLPHELHRRVLDVLLEGLTRVERGEREVGAVDVGLFLGGAGAEGQGGDEPGA
jgi:hypothetical protein